VRPRRFLGPRRILQLSLLVAAAITLLLALTGALNPIFAGLAADGVGSSTSQTSQF
jgi:hypothetical protein